MAPSGEAGEPRGPGPRILLEDVWAGYRRWPRKGNVLHGVGWSAGPGTVTALVGPNGAGKSTTFRLLLGVLVPRRGTVSVGGALPARHRVRRGVGFLPEARVPLPGWTVGALTRAGCAPGGPAPETVLARAGLASLAGRRVDRLSRGQARAALLAYALAADPGLVLLDEPWSGLDADARVRLGSTLASLRERGRTVVVSSHELLEVARVADRVVVLSAGRVALQVEGAPLPAAELERVVRGAGP